MKRMTKTTILCTCIGFFALFTTPVKADKIRVACIGNSITAGFYNYPTPLGAMLGDEYDVRSFGKGGAGIFIGDRLAFDGHSDGIYVHSQEYAEALAFNPDIVTIKLGTNDVGEFFFCEKNFWYIDCGRKVLREGVRERFKADYMTIINRLKELPAQPRILLCYPVRLYPKGMFGQGAAMDEVIRTEQRAIVDEIAAEQGFPVIDLWEPTKDMEENFPDGCHPNHQGSYEIAKEIYRGITGLPFDEQAAAAFLPELKTAYCIVNRQSGKVMEVRRSGSTYGVVTNDFVADNPAQLFWFENLTHDVFRIRTSFETADAAPYYLAIKSGPVGLLGIGDNWGANDNTLSVQVALAGDGFYTLGLWNADSYMGFLSASSTVRGGKKRDSLQDTDYWVFVKAAEMASVSIEEVGVGPYRISIRNGNTIVLENVVPSDVVALYNLVGQRVYSAVAGGGTVFIAVARGVYVLRVNGRGMRVWVR